MVILHWHSKRRFLHYVKFFIPEEELRSCHFSCFNLHPPVSGISRRILITILKIVIVKSSILHQVFDRSIETLFFREYLFLKKVQGTDLNLVRGTISLEVMLISCDGASASIWFDWCHQELGLQCCGVVILSILPSILVLVELYERSLFGAIKAISKSFMRMEIVSWSIGMEMQLWNVDRSSA